MFVPAILTGMVTGILSGLLGIGGGAILVASSVLFMGIGQHAAQAAALAAMIPTALAGVARHHRNKLIQYQVLPFLAVGLIFGGLVGALAANHLPELVLRRIFSAFFAIMSLQMLWSSFRQAGGSSKKEKQPQEKNR